uniref:Transmembrane protein 70 homolog, mitochondrial n=2 Tax=Cuerna arida TaxID=1464854 RepID=A0A1B6FD07_9HEMI
MSVRVCLGLLMTRQVIRRFSLTMPCIQSCSRILVSKAQNDCFPVKVPCQKYATTASPNQNLGVEIYNGPLARRIRSVKLFSLSTSLMGLIAQPIIIERIMETGVSIVAMIFSGAVVQFFTFVTPVVLHYFTKKYVKVMYYDPETDTYTAVTHTFWATDKVLPFKLDDVVIPDIPRMFTTIIVKGNPLFFDINFFEDVGHYKKLMGFDKPIDFKLEDKPPKS